MLSTHQVQKCWAWRDVLGKIQVLHWLEIVQDRVYRWRAILTVWASFWDWVRPKPTFLRGETHMQEDKKFSKTIPSFPDPNLLLHGNCKSPNKQNKERRKNKNKDVSSKPIGPLPKKPLITFKLFMFLPSINMLTSLLRLFLLPTLNCTKPSSQCVIPLFLLGLTHHELAGEY